MFGSENNDYEVILEIKESSNNSTVVSKAGTFSLKLIEYKGSSYYGFEVLFDCVADLKKTTEYGIEDKISGPPSWARTGGLCGVLSNTHKRNSMDWLGNQLVYHW